MDDIFGRLWDRFPERRSRPYYYGQNPNRNPYPASYAPDYFYQPQPVTQSVPRLKPRTFSVPVSDYQNPPSTNRPREHYSFSTKPKNVISVPVTFGNSDASKAPSNGNKKAVVARPSMDKSTAAVKVQKVFRGFSVRKSAPLKNLKIIAKVRAESEEIRMRISDEKVVDSVRRDQKERLKITEWIMSLLLKLDAIQGVNSVVRESRKAATRELVNLQETVDAIIAGKPMEVETHKRNTAASRTEDKSMEEEMHKGDTTYSLSEDKPMEEDMHKGDTACYHTEDKPDILDKDEEPVALECLNVNCGEEIKEENGLDHPIQDERVDYAEMRDSKPADMQAEESLPTQMHNLQVGGSCETEEFCSSRGTGNNVEVEEVRHNAPVSGNGLIADMLETETIQGDENIKAEDKNMEDEVGDATGTKDILSKGEEAAKDIGMVREENKRLKTMVDDLLKKSEKQIQMIDNLSCRIAQLEDQVSNKKKIAEQRKKTRVVTDIASQIGAQEDSENATTALTDERMPQPHERRRRRKSNMTLNGLRGDWF